jgi:hypothetical protein
MWSQKREDAAGRRRVPLVGAGLIPRSPRPRRPQLGPLLRRVIRDAAARLPALEHVRASRILVVAGEARRASRATIRPTSFADTGTRRSRNGRVQPLIRFRGRRILYVITLRPLFFRRSTVESRVATLLHELYHTSPSFDGTLHHGRRHRSLPSEHFSRDLRPLVATYLAAMPEDLRAALDHHGEVLVRQWLEGPPRWLRIGANGARQGRRTYDEDQLFLGPIMMVTPTSRRSGHER